MKRADSIKTLQLVLFMIMAAICVVIVVLRGGGSRITGMLLLLTLSLSFFFIFVDFIIYARQQNDYNTMMDAMRSDPVARIANRYSVDALIDKYDGQALPKDFCCLAFEITNIKEINMQFGRKAGNDVIRQFSVIMKMASLDRYFVGRNGGNRFIAMTESGTEFSIQQFLSRIEEKVEAFNSTPGNPTIQYTVGSAYHEHGDATDIIAFVAMANRRIGEGFVPEHEAL